MSIYKPSELLPFLRERGLHPKKGLSQNFLIDGNIIRKIVSAADVHEGDAVLEIGPGPGSLTQALLNAGAHVLAVEKDVPLAEALGRLQTTPQKLVIRSHDIMDFPLEEELVPFLQGCARKKAKVIANLPYHLTTPILIRFAQLHHLFDSITVMVQQEVARRMTASPSTSDYGSLTLFLRYYAEPHYAFTVSRNCFYPVPSVDSAVVVLTLKPGPLSGVEEEAFFQMTRTAFKHRRKMLRASLKAIYPSTLVENALKAIGINPQARPEELSLEVFLALFDELSKKNEASS